MILYELLGADDRRFSPYCWRTRMALAHKGFEPERVPCKFTEIADKVGFSGQGRVPVLVDGDTHVADSWSIACYLEDTYPDRPSLFGGEVGRSFANFMNCWADRVMMPALGPVLIPDVYEIVHDDDRRYFKDSREQRFGRDLEALHAARDGFAEALATALAPLNATLESQDFFSGSAPLYPDFVIFGNLQWARCTSADPVLSADDALYAWRERMLDLFDGLARATEARAAA